MALSKCGSCGHGFFEVRLFEPRGGRYKLNFVQCASCGVPISTEGYFDEGAQLEVVKETLAGFDARIQRIERTVANIDQNVAALARIIDSR